MDRVGKELADSAVTMPDCEIRIGIMNVFMSFHHNLEVFNTVIPDPNAGTPDSSPLIPPFPGVRHGSGSRCEVVCCRNRRQTRP